MFQRMRWLTGLALGLVLLANCGCAKSPNSQSSRQDKSSNQDSSAVSQESPSGQLGIEPEGGVQSDGLPNDWPPVITGQTILQADTSTFQNEILTFSIPTECLLEDQTQTISKWVCGQSDQSANALIEVLDASQAQSVEQYLKTNYPSGEIQAVSIENAQDAAIVDASDSVNKIWVLGLEADGIKQAIKWQSPAGDWGNLAFSPSVSSVKVK